MTPVTGCPSLSSSEEEDNQFEASFLATNCVPPHASVSSNCLSSSLTSGPAAAINLSSTTTNASNLRKSSASNILRLDNKTTIQMNSRFSTGNALAGSTPSSQHQRFNEYDEPSKRPQSSSPTNNFASGSNNINNRNNIYRQTNLPISTKISITAPSPMGSMREVNRGSADSHTISNQLIYNNNNRCRRQEDFQLIERTSELSLNNYDQQSNNKQHREIFREEQTDYYGSASSVGASTTGISSRRNGSADAINYDMQHLSTTDPAGATAEDNVKSRSQLIDELLKTINDDSFNDIVDFNNKISQQQEMRPKSAIDGSQQQRFSPNTSANQLANSPGRQTGLTSSSMNRPNSLALGNNNIMPNQQQQNRSITNNPSTFDNVFRRMSTNIVQNFNKMSGLDQTTTTTINIPNDSNAAGLRREKSSNMCANSLYVDNQIPARRHSDNTINVPRIQVALSSPQASHGSRSNLNQRASVSASKLANKWKLSAKTNQRESSDKLSPNLSSALGYMRRHSSGNTTGSEKNESNNHQTSNLLFSTSPFKVSLRFYI